MSDISGTFRHHLKPVVYFEAKQDGEKWIIVVRSAAQRLEASTYAPSPFACIERLVGEILDGVNREIEAGPYDMNKKLARPLLSPTTPLRRRGKIASGDLPQWSPPETD